MSHNVNKFFITRRSCGFHEFIHLQMIVCWGTLSNMRKHYSASLKEYHMFKAMVISMQINSETMIHVEKDPLGTDFTYMV